MKDEDVIETFFVYILFKKDKKRLNILKKMNSLKKGEEVSLLNFEGGPGIVLLNFEGGSGAPLLNYEGGPGSRVPGPTFTLCLGRLLLSFLLFNFKGNIKDSHIHDHFSFPADDIYFLKSSTITTCQWKHDLNSMNIQFRSCIQQARQYQGNIWR